MRRSTRWLVPAGVAGLIAAAALAPGASADLPARTPQEVLVLAAESDVDAFSGTVLAVTDLGIPNGLLAMGDAEHGVGGAGLGDSERTVRLWKDGDDLARASIASTMGEQTLIRNGNTLWHYDSSTATVTTATVPEHDPGDPSQQWDGGEVPDPAAAADWLLAAVEPTTEVSAGEPVVVADRAAYEVVLTPTQPGTLIGSASMAVDADTGAVLRVQVTARGDSEPAIDVGFTSFDPTAPPPRVFAVDTPPGATVEEFEQGDESSGAYPGAAGEKPDLEVVGEGWTSVLVVPADAVESANAVATRGALPPELLQPVDGGAVLTTSLVSVMVADDGRVLMGAVTPEVLAAAAA